MGTSSALAQPWYNYPREFVYARAISLPTSELGDWHEEEFSDVQFWPCSQRAGTAHAGIYSLCAMQAVSTHTAEGRRCSPPKLLCRSGPNLAILVIWAHPEPMGCVTRWNDKGQQCPQLSPWLRCHPGWGQLGFCKAHPLNMLWEHCRPPCGVLKSTVLRHTPDAMSHLQGKI